MREIRLGRTGVRVPVVGVGTWSYGASEKRGGNAVGWTGHDDEDARRALETAFDGGLTHWDTADVYGDGHSEELLGSMWDRLPRERVLLASKVGWDPGPHEGFYHPEQVRRQLEGSLRRLGTDTIDLYYMHHCDFGPGDEHFDSTLELFGRFREEGKIRFVGLSDWDPRKLLVYARRVDPDVVQPYRNVRDDAYAPSGLASWVREADAGVAFFSPLKHGLLLGKYEEPPELPDDDFRSQVEDFSDAELIDHLRRLAGEVEARFDDHPEPVLHALTGPLLEDSPTACVLLGLRDERQAGAAVAVARGEAMSAQDAAWVRRHYGRPGGSGDGEAGA